MQLNHGIVTKISYDSLAGNSIVIYHGRGVITRYHHIADNKTYVKVGQIVNKGTKLAYAGNTGAANR